MSPLFLYIYDAYNIETSRRLKNCKNIRPAFPKNPRSASLIKHSSNDHRPVFLQTKRGVKTSTFMNKVVLLSPVFDKEINYFTDHKLWNLSSKNRTPSLTSFQYKVSPYRFLLGLQTPYMQQKTKGNQYFVYPFSKIHVNRSTICSSMSVYSNTSIK